MFDKRLRNILYVDDGDSGYDVLKDTLSSERDDCEVTRATYSSAAEHLSKRGKFDLLILDDDGVSGGAAMDLCRKIRGVDVITPIVVLTSNQSESGRAQAAAFGATAFIDKPEHFREVVGAIDTLLPQVSLHNLRYVRGPRARSVAIV